MKFVEFLKENEEGTSENTIGDIRANIISKLKEESKNLDIYIVDELYFVDYKSEDDIVEDNDVAGYYIYKNKIGELDDFYYSKFIYRVQEDSIDITYDEDNDDSYKTLADITIDLTKLKVNKID